MVTEDSEDSQYSKKIAPKTPTEKYGGSGLQDNGGPLSS